MKSKKYALGPVAIKPQDPLYDTRLTDVKKEPEDEIIDYKKIKDDGKVNSLSAYVTSELYKRLKHKKIAKNKKILVIREKGMGDIPKSLIEIRDESPKDKVYAYHKKNKHLPMYNKAIESFCKSNDIQLFHDIDLLSDAMEDNDEAG